MSVTALERRPGRIPGETGVWVLVLGEMVVFAILFGAFLYTRAGDPTTFADSRAHLNQSIGAVNTLLLLTSSLLVATGVRHLRRQLRGHAARAFAGAGACAAGFAAFKGVEYSHELSRGLTPGTNDFFTYFYVLTGLHFLHLLVGTVVLFLMWRAACRPSGGPREQMHVECGASYWHMVDLLWVVLFPLLYLAATP